MLADQKMLSETNTVCWCFCLCVCICFRFISYLICCIIYSPPVFFQTEPCRDYGRPMQAGKLNADILQTSQTVTLETHFGGELDGENCFRGGFTL